MIKKRDIKFYLKHILNSKRQSLNKLLRLIKQDNEVLAVVLFGSFAQKNFTNASDIDICLVMERNNYSQEELFQKRLDYLKFFDMDIQIFQQLPLYIRVRILGKGKILFCRDEDKLYEIAFHTISEFTDFEHIYRDYLKEVESVR
ncbi:MAG: nucleotidyltransferase domain-containing protein [Candidatus Omnitrophica bacterium]|nr:nucleotidyltransferase domain-containing protein [Candidatus Omnitrophota bacterium]